jgi:chromosome segregation ATPase
MSQNLCHKCGRKTKKNARFCHYCGVRLNITQESPATSPVKPTSKQESSVPSEKDLAPTAEALPAEVETALILRGKLEKLREEKIAIEEELETIRVKQLVGEFTEANAKKQIETVEAKLEPLEKEIRDLEEKASTPLELLREEHKTQEERIERLETLHKSGEVEKSVYQQLASEYQGKLNEIDQQLRTELDKVHRWLSQLEVQRQQLEFDKETLQVRAKIDEISKRDANKKLGTIEKEIAKITSVLDGLRAILSISPVSEVALPVSKARKTTRKTRSGNCPHCGNKISSDSKYCFYCGRLLAG